MRTMTLSLAAAFLAGLVITTAGPAMAEGDCPFGHKTKTAGSTPNTKL